MRSFLQALAAWMTIVIVHLAAIWFLRQPSPVYGVILEILFICGSLVMGFVTYRALAGQALALRIFLALLAAGVTFEVSVFILLAVIKPD